MKGSVSYSSSRILVAAISLFIQIPLYVEQCEIVQRLQQEVNKLKKKCGDNPDKLF